MKALFLAAVGVASITATSASAAITTYANQATFQAALDGSFTLVNLDAAPLSTFASGYHLEDAGPAAAFATFGVDFINFNAEVQGGQAAQIPSPGRDRLIFNGTGFGGTIAINFASPVDGVGAFSNLIDGGRVRAFSGANLGGTFLGEFGFGPGSFGGLTSDQAIGSVQFTCDFNSDLRCGVYDIQFGTFAPNAAVPEPATWAMMVGGFGLLGGSMRYRRRRPRVTYA